MSPTIFRSKGYRFFFFSREEKRMHVHVLCADGEAKLWLEPAINTAKNYGLSRKQLNEVKRMVEENKDAIKAAWRKHFKR